MESYVFQPEPNRQEVIRLADEIIAEYPDQRRPYSIAWYFQSTSHRTLGNKAQAKAGFEKILDLELKEKEMDFESLNVNAWALLELAVFARNTTIELPKALELRRILKDTYPDSKQAKMIGFVFFSR